jgi:hypothetical protein
MYTKELILLGFGLVVLIGFIFIVKSILESTNNKSEKLKNKEYIQTCKEHKKYLETQRTDEARVGVYLLNKKINNEFMTSQEEASVSLGLFGFTCSNAIDRLEKEGKF